MSGNLSLINRLIMEVKYFHIDKRHTNILSDCIENRKLVRCHQIYAGPFPKCSGLPHVPLFQPSQHPSAPAAPRGGINH